MTEDSSLFTSVSSRVYKNNKENVCPTTNLRKCQKENIQPTTNLRKCHEAFDKWLHLTKSDHEGIDIVLASALDRDVGGDPCWLFLIAPSGGTKTEIIRSLREYKKTYSLSSLTSKTFVSGKMVKTENGEFAVQGLLPKINGKVLLIKDFTVLLSMPDVERNEIFGQFRDIYDGFFEKGFGNFQSPIRVLANIGLICGVTPAIDSYQKLATTLGERFLKVRLHSEPEESARMAAKNRGQEDIMRSELCEAVNEFLSSLDFSVVPTLSQTQNEEIISIAMYVAIMRAWVYCKLNYKGEIIEMNTEEPEMPTRVCKQLSKLVVALAILRGHKKVEEDDMATLRRVARDTSIPKRQRIIDSLLKGKENSNLEKFTFLDAAEGSGLHYNTAKREVEKMVSLGIFKDLVDENIKDVQFFRVTDAFRNLVQVVNKTEEAKP